MPARRTILLLAALALPATAFAQAFHPEPVAMRRPGPHAAPWPAAPFVASDAATTQATTGDGPWSRQKSMTIGATVGGTVGLVAGAIIAWPRYCDADSNREGSLADPVTCLMVAPLQVIAGGVVGGLVGGGLGALAGRAVCEHHDAGCIDDPPKPERNRPPPRRPRPLPVRAP